MNVFWGGGGVINHMPGLCMMDEITEFKRHHRAYRHVVACGVPRAGLLRWNSILWNPRSTGLYLLGPPPEFSGTPSEHSRECAPLRRQSLSGHLLRRYLLPAVILYQQHWKSRNAETATTHCISSDLETNVKTNACRRHAPPSQRSFPPP